jgi:aldehyde:ferredoxin oxidoreductase
MAYGGWTGKVLRVDLSQAKIGTSNGVSTEDTIAKYKDVLGGTGIGWKVLFDEVPPNVKAWDPENRVVFGVGPVTGSGAPVSGRTSIITRWPVHKDDLPASGHMGGHWGSELKYAGWDSIIVQGKAPSPV